MKDYEVIIALQTISVKVKAKNKTEARQKAYAKLDKKPPSKYIDKLNTSVEDRTFW